MPDPPGSHALGLERLAPRAGECPKLCFSDCDPIKSPLDDNFSTPQLKASVRQIDASHNAASMLRQRRQAPTPSSLSPGGKEARAAPAMASADDDQGERRPLLDAAPSSHGASEPDTTWTRRNQWIVLAIASGACAAFNGVFAKLYVIASPPRLLRWQSPDPSRA